MKGQNLAKLAWRNLWRQKRRTLLTLFSIVFGFFLSFLMNAMQDQNFADMVDLAARLGGGHVVVQHNQYIDAPSLKHTTTDDGISERLQTQPHVHKVTHRITGQIMVATAHKSTGAFFIAYDPAKENDSTLSFLEGIKEGQLFDSADEKGIILGQKLAKNLGVKMGGKVVYTLMDKNGEIATGMGRLSGIIGTGAGGIDSSLVLLPINIMRSTLGYASNEVTQLAVYLNNSKKSSKVAFGINQGVVQGPTTAYPWAVIQPELKSFIAMKVGGAWVISFIVALLVSAGIFNTVFVSVMERMREFGILMAIGFEPRQLFSMVMWESLWLALIGLAGGFAAVAWPYSYLAEHGLDMTAQLGDQALEIAGVGMSPIIKVGIFPEHVLYISCAVVVATLLAGVYPAWRAGRVVPVDSLKLS
jgi:ABC-type lipoprotein release transport system permease subunit